METDKIHIAWLAELFPPQGEWTEEDYFALPDTDQGIELSDGMLRRVPPLPNGKARKAGIQLLKAVNSHIIANNLGETNVGRHRVRLYPGVIRVPEVWFIRRENQARITRQYVVGPPDWIAEIITPESCQIVESDKVADYARAGVPEVWLLDPTERTIRVGTLVGDAYVFTTYGPDEVATSAAIQGFALAVNIAFGESGS